MKRIATFKVLFILSLVAISLNSSSYASGNKLDFLWKARALQAVEKLEKLIKKNGNSKGKNLTKQEHCEWALENVFQAFVNLGTQKLVKEIINKSHNYKIVFVDQDQNENQRITQVNFTYEPHRSLETSMVGVLKIADNWSVGVIPTVPDYIAVKSPKCIFSFPVKDPFLVLAQAL